MRSVQRLLGFLLLGLLSGVGPSLAATRLGLHVTQEELTIWRARRTSSTTIGGVSYATMYTTDILNPANTYRSAAHPSSSTDGYWAGWTDALAASYGSTCFPDVDGPPGWMFYTNGRQMMASAFHYMILGDVSYATPVRTDLLNQITLPGTNFANSTKWAGASGCNQITGAFDGNLMVIISWLSHLLYAYDYLIAGGYTGFSPTEKTNIETWFQNASRYVVGRSNRSVTAWAFANARPAVGGTPNYSTCSGSVMGGAVCPGNTTNQGIVYFGGSPVYDFTQRWGNRIVTACMFGMPAAIRGINGVSDAQTMLDCKSMAQELVRFAMFSDGAVTDLYRWKTDGIGLPSGSGSAWGHGAFQLGSGLVMADALARTGDTSLYTFTSPGGYAPAGTDGNNISLLSGMLLFARMANGTIQKYGTTSSSQLDAAHLIYWQQPPSEGNHSEDFVSAMSNIFYKNAEVTTSYQRAANAPPACGVGNCSGPPWGIFPNVLFMFGNQENIVDPYTLTGGDTTPPAPPTGLTPTVISSSRIDLAWTPPADADLAGYRITYCLGNGCTPITALPSGDLGLVTTTSHTGLTASQVYGYRIEAKDEVPNYSTPSTPVQYATTSAISSPWVGAVSSSSDDATQNVATGAVTLTTPGLDIVDRAMGPAALNLVGLRFANVQVPQGVTLSNTTKLQFTGRANQTPNTWAALLSDNFDDNTFDAAKWTLNSIISSSTDTLVTVVETGGRVTITPRASQPNNHYNGYRSLNTVDFTDGAVLVELVQNITSSPADAILAIGLSDTDDYRIATDGGTLSFQSIVGGVFTTVDVTYSNSTHRWWRIRHRTTGNLIVFDTSPDGQNWTQQHSLTATGFALTAVRVGIEAGTYGSTPTPGQAIFDNFLLQHSTTTAPVLAIRAQSSLTPATFTGTTNDLSNRTLRPESVPWTPGTWTQATANAAALSPDISSLLQPLVNDVNWTPGKDIVLLINGPSGTRTADSFDAGLGTAPTLNIAWSAADTLAPLAPTGLTLGAGANPATDITLSWTAPAFNVGGTIPYTDHGSYKIYLDAISSPTVPTTLREIQVGPGTTYLATPLTPATMYGIAVSAVDLNNNEGAKSTTQYLATGAGTPVGPGIVQAVFQCAFPDRPLTTLLPKSDVNATCRVPSPSAFRLHTGLRNNSGGAVPASAHNLWCQEGSGPFINIQDRTCTDANICYGDDTFVSSSLPLLQPYLPRGGTNWALGYAKRAGTPAPSIVIPDASQAEYLHVLRVREGLTPGTTFTCCERFGDTTELETCIPAVMTVGGPQYVHR